MHRIPGLSIRVGLVRPISTEGCLPSALGARVRLSGNNITVTDGPFTESKEVVGGFAILEARSKEHAIQLAKEFLAVVGGGECEIRQLFTSGECGHAEVAEALKEQFAGN